MTTRNIFIYIVSLVILLTRCTSGFDELDYPKTTVPLTDPEPLFTRSLVTGAGLSTGIWQYSNQLTTLDWVQYLSNIESTFTETQYEPKSRSFDNVWDWWYAKEGFAGLHICHHVIAIAKKLNNPIQLSTASIWRAYMFQYLTDMYGDIPYSQAFTTELPKYDTQKEIYYNLIDELFLAVETLKREKDGGYKTFREADVLYKGSTDKWIKLGNSLLLRLAIQCSKVDPEKTKSTLAKIDFTNTANYIADNSDNAYITPDPLGPTYHVKNPYLIVRPWNGFRISKTFFDRIASDPRKEIIMSPNAAGEYLGLPNGQKVTDLNANYKTVYIPNYCDIGSFFAQDKTSFMLLSAAEVNFLISEAILKGWISGDAPSFFKKGIALSMEYYGVDQTKADTYIASITFNESNLYEQTWIALFPNGPQAWNLIRRTGKPTIAPLIEHWKDNAEMPRRFSYSTKEILYNSSNTAEAIERIGGNSQYTRVWWDNGQ